MRGAGFSLASVRDEQRLRRRYSINDLGIAASVTLSYNATVAAAVPALWWRLDETAGTTAADSGSLGNAGTLTGGATFASSGVSISAPSGYAGLGAGINLSASSVTDVRKTSISGQILGLNNASNDTWTWVVWVAGSAGGSQYIASNVNNAAIIYQFVTDTVEFFTSSFSGTNPRTGSGISLAASDTTTPHMIVYRYNQGTWSGFLDGVSVFSVSRSFAVPSFNNLYLGSDSSTSVCNSRVWDTQCYSRALSDSEISNIYAARNMA